MDSKTAIISTVAAIVMIVGVVFGMSTRYVSKDTFGEFKAGLVHRLDRIDSKLDKLLDKQ